MKSQKRPKMGSEGICQTQWPKVPSFLAFLTSSIHLLTHFDRARFQEGLFWQSDEKRESGERESMWLKVKEALAKEFAGLDGKNTR
jgi:hypothetical protein